MSEDRRSFLKKLAGLAAGAAALPLMTKPLIAGSPVIELETLESRPDEPQREMVGMTTLAGSSRTVAF